MSTDNTTYVYTGEASAPVTQTNMSPSIAKLAEALAAAQGEITGALKDSANPFFKSKYADLAACWDACRAPLSKHGLAVIQTTQEAQDSVKVITMLAHKSGEWIRGELCMTPVKFDPQGIGSCITYARRYALAAMVGLAQIDDDANAASGKDNRVDPRGEGHKAVDPAVRDPYVKRFREAMDADKEEHEIAKDVYAIHQELGGKNDLYIAIGEALPPKYRSAIHEYIQRAKGKKAA